MLDPNRPIAAAGAPGVRVFADDRSAERFYAFPAAPELARSADGAPAISLLVHGRKVGGLFQPAGAYLTLTTRFALKEAEVEAIRSAIAERLRRERGLPAGARLDVQVVSPEWSAGEVDVRLGEGTSLRGTPSLLGGNEAAITASFDSEGAGRLRRHWEAGLEGATIRYRLSGHAARKTRSGGEATRSTEVRGPGYESVDESRVRSSIESTTAVPFPIEAEGPLRLSRAEARAAMQELGG
ncbi:MAG: hypothetical protein ACE15D_14960 [Candidatus Eisenbacteria bacterium]